MSTKRSSRAERHLPEPKITKAINETVVSPTNISFLERVKDKRTKSKQVVKVAKRKESKVKSKGRKIVI